MQIKQYITITSTTTTNTTATTLFIILPAYREQNFNFN